MKSKHTWLFSISLFLAGLGYGQQVTPTLTDSLEQTTEEKSKEVRTYAIRAGVDLVKPIRSTNADFQGLEIVGDLKLNQRLYIATEFGTEQRTQQSELINFSTKGSYFKAGIDYNFFNNWKGMNNALYVGIRYARSVHTHTVNSYELYQLTQYLPQDPITEGYLTGEREQLSNGWIELLFGTKVQLFPNFYAGISARLHLLASNPQPDNFGNLYAPGFNKITDDNKFGAGFNYTLSYAFPFRFKKRKTTVQ